MSMVGILLLGVWWAYCCNECGEHIVVMSVVSILLLGVW